MSALIDTYLERAEQCAREAEATNLPNVREQCRRAEAAWRELAERHSMVDGLRASRA